MKKIFAILSILSLFLAYPNAALADYTITTGDGTTGLDNYADFGETAGSNVLMAQRFTTVGAGTLSQVINAARKAGSPVDSIQILVEADSAGSPSGSAIANGTSNSFTPSATTCKPTETQITATWATPPSLSAATNYWLVFKRTGSADNVNFFYACGGSHYTDPIQAYNGTSWAAYFAGTVSVHTITTVVAAAAPTSNPWRFWEF